MNIINIPAKISKHKKSIVILFTILAVLSSIAFLFVNVNYDMTDYLPEETPSQEAMDVMEEEFSGTVPNARVMVHDVTIPEAMDYKQQLDDIEGVSDIIWLDDAVDITTPLSMADSDTVESYYKDNTALFSIHIEQGAEVAAVDEIYELIGEDNAVSGAAVDTATSQNMAGKESMYAAALLVPAIILILIVSTTSWLEPVLFLVAIGVSILINLGTNIFLGEISFVTQSVSPILQLAVSLDYAIFLLHSFSDHRKQISDVEKAMQLAIKKSFPAIAASAATTFFGFMALTLMDFEIGSDLGINLVKGIVLSFISVMVFLPALTLFFYKWIDKTKHKPMLPSFNKLGGIVLKMRIPALILVAVLIVPAFLAQSNTKFIYGIGEQPETTRAGSDLAEIEETFGRSMPMVVLVPKGDMAKEAQLSEELKNLDHVTSIISYPNTISSVIPPEYLNESVTENFYSENYSRMTLYTDTEAEGNVAFSLIESVKESVASYYDDEGQVVGESVTLYDMRNTVIEDNKVVNLVTVVAIALVLIVTFRSITIPAVLLLTIQAAVWINLSIPYFTDSSLVYVGYLIVSTVQLAATVDYAILWTEDYKERRKRMPAKAAIKETIDEKTFSISISAAILASVGFVLWMTSSNPIVSSIGLLLGRGAVLAFVMVVFLLPALLIVLDKAIEKTTWKPNFYKGEKMMKKTAPVLLAFMLMMPSIPVEAETGANASDSEENQTSGNVSAKDEVIYADLDASGKLTDIYVVNIFDVEKAGTIADYGNYEEVKNLTDLSTIEQNGEEMTIDASEGDFYYQGNIKEGSLPWDIALSYQLDGKKVAPEELVGADGKLEINIRTSANEEMDAGFYENYLLQISLSLDTDLVENIKAEDATIANAGKDKQLTFTVMPEKEGNYTIEADVTDFEMQGMDISAVPSSLPIESPDTEAMTKDIETLSEAIGDVNSGVGELSTGVSELNNGMNELQNGSKSYKQGITELNANSSELTNASKEIESSLISISSSLNGGSMEVDASGLAELSAGLTEIAGGLYQTSEGLQTLNGNYASAYTALDQSMTAIPAYAISEEQIQALYQSGADKATVDQLVETYTAARTANGTYEEVKAAFTAVGQTLEEVSGSLEAMAGSLTTMANELSASTDSSRMADQLAQLQEGMVALASNYGQFHDGLASYTDGVSRLSGSYSDLHAGMVQISDGTRELETGVNELHDGTKELHENTKNMPAEIEKEIEAMMDEYDKSDFEPVSFASERNEQVNNVQFVIKTDSIVKEEEEEPAPQETEGKPGFWARLMDLFS